MVRGSEAFGLLERSTFLSEWARLCQQCPWVSAFQSGEFCAAWYRNYRQRFEPLLVLARDENGRLVGMLPLGASTEDGKIVVAGSWQAEYQCWISTPEIGEAFPWHAMQSLRPLMGRSMLTFRYLPPKVPLTWLSAPEAARISKLSCHDRPLIRFGDGQEIASSLKKKHTKTRLRNLEKLGPAKFAKITDPEEFHRLLREIIPWYDFRQAALHGIAPFSDDPCKKAFHLELSKDAGLLHVTTLRFGTTLASAHIGACGNGQAHLGILTHSPFLAANSPGAFHILFLAQMLQQEGYGQLDLTPGDDAYKQRFANGVDQVHSLTIFPSPSERWKDNARERITGKSKNILKSIHVSPKHVHALREKLGRVHILRTPANLVRGARSWLRRRREMRFYAFDATRGERGGRVRVGSPRCAAGFAHVSTIRILVVPRELSVHGPTANRGWQSPFYSPH